MTLRGEPVTTLDEALAGIPRALGLADWSVNLIERGQYEKACRQLDEAIDFLKVARDCLTLESEARCSQE